MLVGQERTVNRHTRAGCGPVRVSQSMGYLGTISTYGTVIMNAEAGHTYKVKGRIYGHGEELWVWITDEENNQVVAGRKS